MGHSLEFILNHPVLSVALFIFIYLIISYEIKNFTKKYKSINCSDLVTKINTNQIVVLDTREKAEYNAKVQSHLVESINGIETIKGQSLELLTEMRWEKFYANQIKAGFNNTITSVAAGSANQFLQQLSGLIVIWIGAGLVLKLSLIHI